MSDIEGPIPASVWRSGKQFLMTPDGMIWEKEFGLCYAWDSYLGKFGRDDSLPPIRWVDLVKDRSPVKSVSIPEAMVALLAKLVQDVMISAKADLAEHKADNDHYRP